MEQTRFTQPGPVLDAKGRPIPGWAPSGILQYNRKAIRAPFYRIKEWDWYQVSNSHLALQFTLGHASYAGMAGVTLFDFISGERIFQKDMMLALPFGSLELDSSADADSVAEYNKGGFFLRMETKDDVRRIQCRCEGFDAEVALIRQNPHALMINVPFDESPTAFYYNHKISCMLATGHAAVGDKTYTFGGEDEAYGLLDWGRGVWPFHNEWYWSSAAGRVNGEIFGFNLGCGFGNTSAATENCLFYKNEIHKLGQVSFTLGSDYAAPWRLADTEGRLDITLTPTYDRTTVTKLLWVDNCTHQMFGPFAGHAVLDNGTRLTFDNIIGFAEHAVNNW